MSTNGPGRTRPPFAARGGRPEEGPRVESASEYPTDEHTVVDGVPISEPDGSPRPLPSLVVLAGKEAGRVMRVTEGRLEIGRATSIGHLRLADENVSRRHAVIVTQGSPQPRIFDLGSTNGTRVNGQPVGSEGALLEEGDQIQFAAGVVLKFSYQHPLEDALRRNLYDSAVRDGLTGLHNKRYLLERLEQEYAWAMRHKRPLSVAVVDLDHFKSVNDAYGHATGDRVLIAFAEVLRASCRLEDTTARFGGEEFVILQRDTPLELATVACERVRRGLSSLPFPSAQGSFLVTASIGLSSSAEAGLDGAADLFNLADARLYTAKRTGRDRIVSTSPAANPPGRLTGERRRA